jgi:RHS repeat-associated protein
MSDQIESTEVASRWRYGYTPDRLLKTLPRPERDEVSYSTSLGLQCVGTTQTTNCTGGLSITRAPGSSLLTGTTFPVASATPISDTYTPNGFGETLGYVASIGAQSAYTASYTRDGVGRIATKSETLLNADATTSAYAVTYTYDAAGRLTDAVAGDGTDTHYDYDLNGNRLRRSVAGPGGNSEELGTYGVGDQLQTYAGLTYSYTASGMLQSVVDTNNNNATTTYTYDALGNLRSVALPSGETVAYVIDGQNRRVGRMVNDVLVTGWLYEDGLRIAAELDFNAQGQVTSVKRFGYGSKGNVPDLMVMQDGTRYRILSDNLGSPRVVVSESGVVTARMDYDEFGRVLVNTNPGMVPFGFAGGLYDADTGLTRFGARDYDAVTGRWTAKDSLRFQGGDANLYNYCGGDPVNSIDPSGHFIWVIVGVYEAAEGAALITAAGATGVVLLASMWQHIKENVKIGADPIPEFEDCREGGYRSFPCITCCQAECAGLVGADPYAPNALCTSETKKAYDQCTRACEAQQCNK